MRGESQVYINIHTVSVREARLGAGPRPVLKWIPDSTNRKLNGGKHAT
jgi:hypothetical protein